MKKIYLYIFSFIVFFIGCAKEDEQPETPIIQINPPKNITIVSGNNQIGFPYEYLKDSIVIEITPDNIEDLTNYSYYFKSNDYYSSPYAYDTIIESKMYVYTKWRLNTDDEPQELNFILTKKCDDYYNKCDELDSISISANIKLPWKKIFTDASWTGNELFDIHFSNEKEGIVVGDLGFNDGYIKTLDGGITWGSVNNNRSDLYQLSFSNPDTGIVIVTNNYAYFTNNGGQSFYQGNWTPPIVGHRSSSDYYMFNSKEIITVGREGAIAKTKDGGKSWTTYQGFTFKNYLYDITCADDKICYACGSIGKVIKSDDGGETWEEKNLQLNENLKTIYFIDVDFGFTAGEKGALARTIDGGINWEIIQTGLRFTIIEIYFYSKDKGYIVSTSGEIGKTIDGGLTWERLNKGNYGVSGLSRVYFKENDILGLQGGSIFKYELSNE